MTAPLDDVRSGIVRLLEGIGGIGKVHGFERYAVKERDFRALYADAAGHVLGWHVRRVRTHETTYGVGGYDTRHHWRVVGLQAVVDDAASELALDDLVEQIRAAGRADDTLGGVVATCITDERAGFELVDSSPVLFGGVLCHRVILELTTVLYDS